MKIVLKDILPNPYRDTKRNPLDPFKVDALVSSIEDTGFWDNVVVRKNKDGKYELAYGHHRLAAAIKAGLTEADFIVKKLTDAQMLQILARENSETYRYTVLALLESVRGTVEALAAGKIPAFTIDPKVNTSLIRYAPSFVPGKASSTDSVEHPYTVMHVGKFLGYVTEARSKSGKTSDAVQAALNALNLIELGMLKEADVKEWSVDKLLQETRARIAVYKEIVIRREKDAKERAKLREQQLELDRQRKAEVEKERQRAAELLEKEREARKAKAEEEAARYAEERRLAEERRVEREKAFKEKRAKFDAKMEKIEVVAQERKEQDHELPVRQAVKAMLFKLSTITSERFAFREEVKAMARNRRVTVNERELIRQELLKVSEWYAEQAIQFAGVPLPSGEAVLKEARQREETKRKRGRTDEQE